MTTTAWIGFFVGSIIVSFIFGCFVGRILKKLDQKWYSRQKEKHL